jgi:hypothetical protein
MKNWYDKENMSSSTMASAILYEKRTYASVGYDVNQVAYKHKVDYLMTSTLNLQPIAGYLSLSLRVYNK